MAVKNFGKLNDLSDSALRKKYLEHSEYKPQSNKAVAMGRVSIKKNKDAGNSDLAQIEEIEKYAKLNGLDIVESWDVAETASKHEKRKNFIALLDFVRSNTQIKHIIFSHQSRSNRNRESARELEALVRSAGVILHCARDQLKLTPKSGLEEWMRWDLFNNLNEKFIEDHKKNVMGGMIKRIEMGLYPCRAPYGYKNVQRQDINLSVFELNGDKATYMKAAFERFGQGTYSVPALKRELDREFSHLHRTPNKKQLITLLKSPFYHGDFVFDGATYRGNPNYHPPLVSFETWKRVQNVFKRPGRSKRKVTLRNHPYLGLLRCDGKFLDEHGCETDQTCGAAITAQEKRKRFKNGTHKTYTYYHCSRSTGRCSQQEPKFMALHGRRVSYTEAELERQMAEIFAALRFDEEVCKWMQKVLLEEHQAKSQSHNQHAAAVRRRYQMLHHYIDTAYEDKLRGLISEEMWRGKTDAWREELAQLDGEIRAIDGQKDEYIENGVLLIELVQRAEALRHNEGHE